MMNLIPKKNKQEKKRKEKKRKEKKERIVGLVSAGRDVLINIKR